MCCARRRRSPRGKAREELSWPRPAHSGDTALKQQRLACGGVCATRFACPGRFGRRARSSRPGRANGQSPSAALRPCAPAVRTPAVRVVHANPGHLASSRGEPRLASPVRAPAATALPVGPETCSAGPERRGRCAPRRRAGRPPAAVRLAVGVAGTRSPSEAASRLWNGAERARSGGSCRRSPARADETDAHEAYVPPQDANPPPVFVFPPVCTYLGRSPPVPKPRRCSQPFPRRILPRPVPAARTTPAGPPARTRPHTRPHAPRSTRSPPALPRDPHAVPQAPLHARDSSARWERTARTHPRGVARAAAHRHAAAAVPVGTGDGGGRDPGRAGGVRRDVGPGGAATAAGETRKAAPAAARRRPSESGGAARLDVTARQVPTREHACRMGGQLHPGPPK